MYVLPSPAKALPLDVEVGDWDYWDEAADEEFVDLVREGRIGVARSYRSSLQHEFVDLDFAAWSVGRRDIAFGERKRKWVEHVRREGLDHFRGVSPSAIYAVPPAPYNPPQAAPPKLLPPPALGGLRAVTVNGDFDFIMRSMEGLHRYGWNYMEIAEHLDQDPGFVRHHIGGPRVYWVKSAPSDSPR